MAVDNCVLMDTKFPVVVGSRNLMLSAPAWKMMVLGLALVRATVPDPMTALLDPDAVEADPRTMEARPVEVVL